MKTLIAVPCMDTLPMMFVKSLVGLQVEGDIEISFCANSLIYDARNLLAKKAITEGFDRILWLDSDMVFPADLFKRFSALLDNGCDFVSGLYFRRKNPIEPTVFKTIWMGEDHLPHSETYLDYPDQLFEIAACGYGAVMQTVKMIEEVSKEFGLPFSPIMGFGEDISFCMRANEKGYTLYCDPTVKLGHIGYKEFTEDDFERSKQ